MGLDQRPAQAGAAAGVEDVELPGRSRQVAAQRGGHQLGRAIGQALLELLLETVGEAVEGLDDEGVVGPLGHPLAGAGGQHVAGDGVVRLH